MFRCWESRLYPFMHQVDNSTEIRLLVFHRETQYPQVFTQDTIRTHPRPKSYSTRLFKMSYSLSRRTSPFLRLLVFAFIATTTAVVIRDHSFEPDSAIGLGAGRFSENCNGFEWNPKTCVLSANCTVRSDTHDHVNVFGMDNRRRTKLDLNKCFVYRATGDEKDTMREWFIIWDEKGQDRQRCVSYTAHAEFYPFFCRYRSLVRRSFIANRLLYSKHYESLPALRY